MAQIRDPIKMTPGRIRELYVGCQLPAGETIANINQVTISTSLVGLTIPAGTASINASTVEINGTQYPAGTAINYDLDYSGAVVGGALEAAIDFDWTGNLGTSQIERVSVEIIPALDGDYSDAPAIVMSTPIELVLGIATGAQNMGSFTGVLFDDAASVKTLLQATETNLQALNTNDSEHQLVLGVADGSTNLGAFTNRDSAYPTVVSNSTIKAAFQNAFSLLEQHGGYNVLKYGADPSGATSSSAAIQAAHDAASDASRTKNITPSASYAPASIARGGTGNLTATLTVTTASHLNNLDPGEYITVQGASPAAYNGKFVVVSKPTSTTITYTMASDPGASASPVGTFRQEAGSSIFRAIRPFVYFPPGEYQIGVPVLLQSANGQQVKFVGNGAVLFQGLSFPTGRSLIEVGRPDATTTAFSLTLLEMDGLVFRDFDYGLHLGFANQNINLGRMVIRDCDFIGRIGGTSEAIRAFNRSASLTLENVHWDNVRIGLEQQSVDEVFINQPRMQISDWIAGASRKTQEGRFVLRRGRMTVRNGIFNPNTTTPQDPVTKPQSWFLGQEFPDWASGVSYRRGDMVWADATGSEVTPTSLTTYHVPNALNRTGAGPVIVTLQATNNVDDPGGLRNVNVGDTITLAGVTPSGYNGTHTVTDKPSPREVRFTLATDPGAVTVVGNYRKTTNPEVLAVNASAHNLRDGDRVVITGATSNEYNGTFRVIVDGNNANNTLRYYYQPTGTPAANASAVGTWRKLKLWVCKTGDASAATSGAHNSAGSFSTDQATHWVAVDASKEGSLSVWADIKVRDSLLGGEGGGIGAVIWDLPPDGGWPSPSMTTYPRSVTLSDNAIGSNAQTGASTTNLAGNVSPAILMLQIPNRIWVQNNKFSSTHQVAADYWTSGTAPIPWMPTAWKPLESICEGNHGSAQANRITSGGNFGAFGPNFSPRLIVAPSYNYPFQNGLYVPTGAKVVRATWGTAGNKHDIYAFFNVSEGQVFSVLCNAHTRIYNNAGNISTYDSLTFDPGAAPASEGLITFVFVDNKAYEIARSDVDV